jgi:hypothetical protein
LINSDFSARKAIVIYGYEAQEYPLEIAIGAFLDLASKRVTIVQSARAEFQGLVHPVHSGGCVYGWEIDGIVAA